MLRVRNGNGSDSNSEIPSSSLGEATNISYMKLSEFDNLEDIPGIYVIHNNVNDKYYVGQTIRLRTRIQDHYSTAISKKCENQRKRMLLYKAIEKHGIDNFDLQVIYSENTKEFNSIKKTLDGLEKKYIVEYNSYVPNGYNQTKGGDAGVFGLKMNNEQKELISKRMQDVHSDGRYMCYCYDIIDKSYYSAVNLKKLQDILRYNKVLQDNKELSSGYFRNNIVFERFVIARSIDELK